MIIIILEVIVDYAKEKKGWSVDSCHNFLQTSRAFLEGKKLKQPPLKWLQKHE